MAINNNISKKERIVLVDGIDDQQALNLSEEYPFAVFFTNYKNIIENPTGTDRLNANIYKAGHRYTKFQDVDRKGIDINGHRVCLSYDHTTGIVRLYDAFTLQEIELTKIGVTRSNVIQEIAKEDFPVDTNGSYIIASDDNVYTLRYKFKYIQDDGFGNLTDTYDYVDLNTTSSFGLGAGLGGGDIQTSDYVINLETSPSAEQVPVATEDIPITDEDFHTSRKVYKVLGNTQTYDNGQSELSNVVVHEQSKYDVTKSSYENIAEENTDIKCNQYVMATDFDIAEKTTEGNILFDEELKISLDNSLEFEKKLICLTNPAKPYDSTVTWEVTNGDNPPYPNFVVDPKNPFVCTLSGQGDGEYEVSVTMQNSVTVPQAGGTYTYTNPIVKNFTIKVQDNTPYYWYVGTTIPSQTNRENITNEVSKPGFHRIGKTNIENFFIDLKNSPVELSEDSEEPVMYYIMLPNISTFIPNHKIIPVHELDTTTMGYGDDTWEYVRIHTNEDDKIVYNGVTYDVYQSYNKVNQYSGKLKFV